MPVSEYNKLRVRVSNDGLEAYLMMPVPEEGEQYSIELVKMALEQQGVRFGVYQDVLLSMVNDGIYNQEKLIAKGIAPTDGIDGYYDYNFNANFDRKPKVLPDGSVDYWTVHSIESVAKDQVIAVYHPAIQGKNGTNVKGIEVAGKRGKELPLLKGKGFERQPDEVTYVSLMDGKIELQNDRIVILPVHELSGDAELIGGNIDFKGDIVIHGAVESGITIKASGSITIDGVVEACTIEAGKDILLRSGMLGGNKASIKTKGNIFAKFVENTTIEAGGMIQADVLMNCKVTCKERIVLSGKRGSIIGGEIHAVQGVEATSIGNMAETKTLIFAGTGEGMKGRLLLLEKKVKATQEELDKIEKVLNQFKQLEKENGTSYANDPRRMALLRTRIRDAAVLAEDENEIKELQSLIARAKGAVIAVTNEIFPGVTLMIDDERLTIKNNAKCVEFYRLEDKIHTRAPG